MILIPVLTISLIKMNSGLMIRNGFAQRNQ